MKYYRRLSLYRRVQVIAFSLLLFYQVGGFFLAVSVGAQRNEIVIGLGIEMIGAVFTAISVAYIDKSFGMAFDNKYGDPIQNEFNEIKKAMGQLEQQMQQLIEINQHQVLANNQQEIQNQLHDLSKNQELITRFIGHTKKKNRS